MRGELKIKLFLIFSVLYWTTKNYLCNKYLGLLRGPGTEFNESELGR